MTPRGWISLELGLPVFLSFLLAAPALGQDFSWAKRIGGAADDEGRGVAVDTGGNVYSVGDFSTMADFDPGPGAS